jgi:hypothetical protein
MYGSQKIVSPFEGAFVNGIENGAAVLHDGFQIPLEFPVFSQVLAGGLIGRCGAGKVDHCLMGRGSET